VLWVAKAWVIGAAGMLVALALLGRFHHLGRQFGRVPAAISRAAKAFRCGCGWACCLLSVMIDVRLSVLFSYQSNDQFSRCRPRSKARELRKTSAIDSFWWSILIWLLWQLLTSSAPCSTST